MSSTQGAAIEFSIIIPTFRRPERLVTCLRAACSQAYPRENYEVIVVDDGGGGIRERLESEGLDKDVVLLEAAHGGPARARNAGARRATKPYLAFVDDDCVPDRNWLACLARQFHEQPDCMAGGHTDNVLLDSPCAAASQILIDYLYDYYGANGGIAFFTSNNLAVPASRFNDLEGFDGAFPRAAGEDRDFCQRWRERDWPVSYVPEALVGHAHAMSLGRFIRQHFHYGCAAYQFRRARLRRGTAQSRVEPLAFYLDLIGYPFAHSSADFFQKLRLCALLIVSQAVNASGFFWQLAKERLR